MRKIACLFVVLAGLSLSACTELQNRMEQPSVDLAAVLIVTFGALGLARALRRG